MDAQRRFEEIVDDLAAQHGDVAPGKMFGMPCIKRGSKAIGGLYGEEMVFKLTDPAVREAALALDGAKLFDPMGGRPMKEWVQVPADHADEWLPLARQALGA